MTRAFLLWLLLLTACSYRPARFADRAVVTEVADEKPIPLPARSVFLEPVYLSEVYLRRPLVDALDAERFPNAGDVNAFDEVPRSSWWDPVPLDGASFERAYAAEGPPVEPFTVLGDPDPLLTVVRDRRGRGWVLRKDEPDWPDTRVPAALIASRLVRAVGYRTPEVWLLEGKTAATRWPPGIELGPTEMSGKRGDDPNDRIEHENRRTLRALGVLASWIDLRDLGPGRLLDVYVGAPPHGHVQHFVVGLHNALGASALGTTKRRDHAVGVVSGNVLTNLVTLGLNRLDTDDTLRERDLRALSPLVPKEFRLQRPFDPVGRLLAPDGYWMAKRIAALPSELIRRAVASAELEPGVAEHVRQALEARRQIVVSRWMRGVTPLELVELSGNVLVLEDRAIALGHASDASSRYRVHLLDDEGRAVHGELWARARQGRVELALPPAALSEPYLVVRMVAWRRGSPLPRAFEAHISTRRKPHVVGIRH